MEKNKDAKLDENVNLISNLNSGCDFQSLTSPGVSDSGGSVLIQLDPDDQLTYPADDGWNISIKAIASQGLKSLVGLVKKCKEKDVFSNSEIIDDIDDVISCCDDFGKASENWLETLWRYIKCGGIGLKWLQRLVGWLKQHLQKN